MILEIRANQPGFRTVRFQPGFNVILAERTRESTKRDSRNGLGKSTLVEIIHFCMASDPATGNVLRRSELEGWIFEMDMVLRGNKITIRRSTFDRNQIQINGDTSDWPIQPKQDPDTGNKFVSRIDWSKLLGWGIFGLQLEEMPQQFRPTFRSLISYIVRNGQGAFLSPFENHPRQKTWDKQVNTAYLLGLQWEHASRWQTLKDRANDLKNLGRIIRSGLQSEFLGTLGSLESTRVRLERELDSDKRQLSDFAVHPQYRQIELEASSLTRQIKDLINTNVVDQGLVEMYSDSLVAETPASERDVARVYEAAGVYFPDSVSIQLSQAREFHDQVAKNRRRFLEGEIGQLNQAIAERVREIQLLSNAKIEKMEVLQAHGALNDYSLLQQRLSSKIAELEDVNRRINLWHDVEKGEGSIRIEREQLRIDARSDFEDRRDLWAEEVALFNFNSQALYETPGVLIINIDETGFRFDVEIERSGSAGIDKMKIFCYDLMIAQTWSQHSVGPNLLVHDSIIFDAVDERQRAKALELAQKEAEDKGFQYICCLNSDTLPVYDFSPDFDIMSYIRFTLSDQEATGSLLGIRF